MIKKLLLSLAIIGVVGGTAFAGTRALLSDTVSLTANTFSTGSVDLQVSNLKTGSSSTFSDSQAGFTDTMFPGQTKTKFFRLKNNGTGVDLSIAAQASSVSGTINSNDVTVAITPVNNSDIPAGATVSATLNTWVSAPASISPPNIAPGQGNAQRYQMDVSISSGVSASGASSIFDFIFTGTQAP